jgi:poly(A) polymerase
MEKALAIQKQVIEVLGTDEVYLVGGSVRDIVLGQEAKDFDFTTPMLPDEVEAKVKASGRRAYAIGKKFGTIGFKVEVEPRVFEYVEVTTFRSEVYTSKSRKPEVQFVPSLDEDLARRDFTFNAMVLKVDGTIYDPYGGRIDILKRLINTVGLPKDRIQEDPLRILRAARFAARYGFTIDPNFIGKARHLADRIYDVSIERWVQELDKMLVSEHYEEGQEALHMMGMWYRILPEMYGENVLPLDDLDLGTDVDLAWAKLLSGIDANPKVARYINGGICQRLKFSNQRTKTILEYKKTIVKR